MKPILTFQCNESWDRMKIGMVSRFCDNCQRDVMDFTKMRREEVLEYLWTNRHSKVCGRIYKSQLDFHHEEILITIEAFLKTRRNSNLAFYLLAASGLLLTGCYDETKSYLDTATFPPPANTLQMSSVDTVDVTPPEIIAGDNRKTSGSDELPFVLENGISDFQFSGDMIVFGGLGLSGSHGTEGISLMGLAPVMPEFEGGYDGLMAFMKIHLQYPEWEKQNRVEGVAVVAFIIDAEGNVAQPKIVKSIPNAKNIDQEILRVVNLMPKWTPGSDMGKNVPVEFTLPVRFKI